MILFQDGINCQAQSTSNHNSETTLRDFSSKNRIGNTTPENISHPQIENINQRVTSIAFILLHKEELVPILSPYLTFCLTFVDIQFVFFQCC
jgi:hypothetical protein